MLADIVPHDAFARILVPLFKTPAPRGRLYVPVVLNFAIRSIYAEKGFQISGKCRPSKDFVNKGGMDFVIVSLPGKFKHNRCSTAKDLQAHLGLKPSRRVSLPLYVITRHLEAARMDYYRDSFSSLAFQMSLDKYHEEKK